ncbi:MAG: amidohydrolase family protein, partial [Bdellovibrionota bacterium]
YYVHLRKLENVHHDLSLCLQYYEDSSLLMDFKKLIKWTDKKKMMFGSDFPDFSPKKQYELLMKICDELKLSVEDREAISFKNARDLYGISGV